MEPIREPYHRYLRYFLSKDDSTATLHDQFMALAYAVRSEMVDRWIRTQNVYHSQSMRRVYYLSPEYTFGKSLHQNVLSLGLLEDVQQTARDLGFSLDDVFEKEDDLDLGNGAKARQAACIQEAMSTLGLPGMGYGLRYDYGQFRQRIDNGSQVEVPYDWQNREHPWEIPRPEYQCTVHLGGESEPKGSDDKRAPHWWRNALDVLALPTDIPIPGHGSPTVNTLRLWSSRPSEQFPSEYAHHGDYVKACEDMAEAGRITRVLHPDSDVLRSTPGRVRLQYFLVSTSLQDILRRYKADRGTVEGIERTVVIHLSGSNCALAVPEMMHQLVDVEEVPWDAAWNIVRNLFTYTSHAVSADQLELWPVYMLEQLLPRHMEIIYELNASHLRVGANSAGSESLETVRDLSVIEEGEVKRVKMSHLALLASTCLNGVSASQVGLLRSTVFPRMLKATKKKVCTVNSGVSHRRWLLGQNEPLAGLITDAIGDGWILDPARLRDLEPLADDSAFLDRFAEAKLLGKRRLLTYLRDEHAFEYNEDALFDVQCMRIHPCRRQVLNLLHVVWRYLKVKNGAAEVQDRLHIFGGKAMPSDFLAKQTISLIHIVAHAINSDGAAAGRMRVFFIPDYSLTWADRIHPGIELSEAIGAPLSEAAPTTHCKAVLNGALAIASRGGSNDDFAEVAGEDGAFLFGSTEGASGKGAQNPSELIYNDSETHAVFNWLEELLNSHAGGDGVFPLISSIRDNDRYGVVRDFADYRQVQHQVDTAFADRRGWNRRAVLALSRAGEFSCDRGVQDYARDIWNVEAVRL